MKRNLLAVAGILFLIAVGFYFQVSIRQGIANSLFNKGNYSFMLTPCTICNGDKEHKLPLIELRKSINLSNSILNKNVIMYDNRVSPSSISWDTIKRAYITIHDFIESCRINEDYRNIMQKNPSLS